MLSVSFFPILNIEKKYCTWKQGRPLVAITINKNLSRFAKMARPGTSEWGQIEDNEGDGWKGGSSFSLFLSHSLSFPRWGGGRGGLERKGRRTSSVATAVGGRGMAVRVEREKREGRPWCCWPDDRCNLASRRPASRSNDPACTTRRSSSPRPIDISVHSSSLVQPHARKI